MFASFVASDAACMCVDLCMGIMCSHARALHVGAFRELTYHLGPGDARWCNGGPVLLLFSIGLSVTSVELTVVDPFELS